MAANACANGEPAKARGRDFGRERVPVSKAGAVNRSRKEERATGSRVAQASRMGGPHWKQGLPLRMPNFTP